jgi:KaiC/GvpD/RAD55 family RecA-like ATPase
MKIYIEDLVNQSTIYTIHIDGVGSIKHHNFIPSSSIKIDKGDPKFKEVEIDDNLINGYIEVQQKKFEAEEESDHLYNEITEEIVKALSPSSVNNIENQIDKVSTGTSRLDDILMGGLPFGSNVLVYGPPFMGKEVLVNRFVADGLFKGVPVIYVTTEKTPEEIREEMKYINTGFEEFEKLGLVKFVDSYSRSMGNNSNDLNVIYIEKPTDFDGIQKAINDTSKELLENHEFYRTVFRSVSTPLAYLESDKMFKLMNPIVRRRKLDKSVSMYTIEKGMHAQQQVMLMESLMDGMIEFKVENLNTFLSVKGIGDVKSRAWTRYTVNKSELNIGSYARN